MFPLDETVGSDRWIRPLDLTLPLAGSDSWVRLLDPTVRFLGVDVVFDFGFVARLFSLAAGCCE